MTFLLNPYLFSVDLLAAYTAEVLADSPAGFWLLNDVAVTTAEDSSGNNRDGTYTSGPTHSSDSPFTGAGGSTDFDGSNDWVDVPDNAAYTSTAFSVEIWVKADVVIAGFRGLIVKANSGNTNQEFEFRINDTGVVALILKNTSQTTYRSFTTTDALPDTGWHHIAATTSGTTHAIYFDGVSKAGTAAGPTGTRAGNTTAKLSIGRYEDVFRPYAGLLYGAAFYGTELSAARILAHYEAAT